jgi:hypothetical protein
VVTISERVGANNTHFVILITASPEQSDFANHMPVNRSFSSAKREFLMATSCCARLTFLVNILIMNGKNCIQQRLQKGVAQ